MLRDDVAQRHRVEAVRGRPLQLVTLPLRLLLARADLVQPRLLVVFQAVDIVFVELNFAELVTGRLGQNLLRQLAVNLALGIAAFRVL